jgi:hypothetical protein
VKRLRLEGTLSSGSTICGASRRRQSMCTTCHSDGQRGASPSERRRHQDGFRSYAQAVAKWRHTSHMHARLRLVDCLARAVDASSFLSRRPVPQYCPSSVGLARRPSLCPASVHNVGDAGRLAHPALLSDTTGPSRSAMLPR